MTAERLRALLVLALAEHDDIAAVRPTTTIYSDRLAVGVEDHDGRIWRVHVIKEPL